MTDICVLSGGTGTPKLLRGLKYVLNDFFVIVNTSDDIWLSNLKICPDIDSVIYALSDLIDTEKWWGIKNDSFRTHHMLRKLGIDEFMKIGDLDRAIHTFRTLMLKKGFNLTEITRILARKLGAEFEILPMCDEEVFTQIITPEGSLHFQEFWIKLKGMPDVLDVNFKGIERAKLNSYTKNLLSACQTIIIGPSNPITSIIPIISVKGMKKFLQKKFVIAISPIVGKKPVSGPTAKFMKAKGFDVSPLGILEVYSDFLDILIVDSSDKNLEGHRNGIRIISRPILIKKRNDALQLSIYIRKLIQKLIRS